MWEIVLRTVEVVFVVGGGVGGLYCGRLWLQVQKAKATAEGKDEVIKLSQNNVVAWKSLYDAEHSQLLKYREEQHGRNDDANRKILELTNANAQLLGKTDLSPVMNTLTEFIKGQREFMKEITEINGKILIALTDLGDRIKQHEITGLPVKKRERLTRKRGS
jgi:hypothetical protein